MTAATKSKDACSLEKSNDKPRQCIKKQRHNNLPTKVCIVKAMVSLVVMYGCESWTIKKNKKRLSDEELMPLNCGAG